MSELFKNYQNIAWRIESITPTYSRAGLKDSFFLIDDDENPTQSGYDRSFQVAIIGGSTEIGVTDMHERETQFSFAVEVYYNQSPLRLYMYEMISNDQRNIVWALENSDNWVGYSDTNTTDDISLIGRSVDRISITEETGVWVLRLEVTSQIYELRN